MPFGFGKSRRRQLADLPDDWVGWLEPGVEVEGKMKVTSGLIRVNAHFKGEIRCEGTVVVHDQGEVDGEIHTRIISVTGKIKGEHPRLRVAGDQRTRRGPRRNLHALPRR